MITTSNHNLKKPETTDNADLTVFVGDNMDIVDGKLSIKKTGLTLLQTSWVDNTGTTGYFEYTITDSDVATSSFLTIHFDTTDIKNYMVNITEVYITEQTGSYLIQVDAEPTGDIDYRLVID